MSNLILAYTEQSLEKLPRSVQSALVNQVDCIKQCDEEIASLNTEIDDIDRKIAIAKDIAMPVKSFKNVRSRRIKAILTIERAKKAYRAGFMEIPELGNGREIDTNNKEGDRIWHKAILPLDAPLRVFEDLKTAKESGLFDDIIIYQPSGDKKDPILAGRVAGRVFLIANWR